MKKALIFIGLIFSICSAQVRQPMVAGTFYPAQIQKLTQAVEYYLQGYPSALLQRKPTAVIVPHAGYKYSAHVAAAAYREVQDRQYDCIVILSPSHTEYFDFVSVYSGECYEIPGATMSVEKNVAQELTEASRNIKLSETGHVFLPAQRGEHAIEVQLPFIHAVQPGVPIVPVVIGSLDYDVIEELGNKLADLIRNRDVLIVCSSDLSHYHSADDCRVIDGRLIKQLSELDAKNFYNGIRNRQFEACGAAPITATLVAFNKVGGYRMEQLKYSHSGENKQGDQSRVVGYLAAAFVPGNKEDVMDKGYLNEELQAFLMDLAEKTVDNVVKHKHPIPPKDIPVVLTEKRGAFVTLTKEGHLRGCIGYILPVKPLYETVMEVAESAALRDPRFPKVTPQELKDIEVEVSVLTVPELIEDPEIIEVGKHGIIIRQGYYQGLLLPQVATEYDWDRVTFLEHTCQKAGLHKNAWKEKETEIQVFSAQVFNRETLEKQNF